MTKLDRLLYWYTLIFSTSLIVSAFAQGFNLTNLTILAFFLPVPAYLLLQALKRYYLLRSSPPDHLTTQPPVHLSAFALKPFLTQTNPAFIITLVLLLAAWLIILIQSL